MRAARPLGIQGFRIPYACPPSQTRAQADSPQTKASSNRSGRMRAVTQLALRGFFLFLRLHPAAKLSAQPVDASKSCWN
jgi:hypothetical protein